MPEQAERTVTASGQPVEGLYLPEDVSDLDGVLIGVSGKDDRACVPVSLSGDAVGRNILLMDKTQMGEVQRRGDPGPCTDVTKVAAVGPFNEFSPNK